MTAPDGEVLEDRVATLETIVRDHDSRIMGCEQSLMTINNKLDITLSSNHRIELLLLKILDQMTPSAKGG